MQAPEFLKDRYSRFELLGSGGMGMVYRAFDQTLQREVAIKVLPGEKLTPERAMRFQQEARSLSKLKHPNLITILDFGISPQGEPFLIMDCAGGTTLDQIVGEGGVLDPYSALSIAIRICEGIKHAHANGVIHRDLKPSNIMVAYDDLGVPSVTVLDFGIAKVTDDGRGMTLTPKGGLIGTPYFMSPEQIAGLSVDARSDIYSIGCILFALLAGSPPFPGVTAIQSMHDARTLKAPSIHDVNPDIEIPAELEELVSKALMKNPSERQQSAAELQNELLLIVELIEEMEERLSSSGDTSNGGSGNVDVGAGANGRRGNAVGSQKISRVSLVGILIGLGTLVCLAVIGYMTLTSTGVTPPMVAEGAEGAIDELTNWSSTKDSKGVSKPTAGGNGNLWKEHFEGKFEDGMWSYQAHDTMTDNDLRQMFKQHVKMRSFKLTSPDIVITPQTCELISRLPIEQIDFSNSMITDECLPFIGRMKNLTKLEFSDTNVSDKGIEFLRDLKKLENIQLSKTRITDKSMDVLKNLKELKNVELFSLPVTDAGIAKLKNLPVTDIGLMTCPYITDKVFEPLAESGRLVNIDATATKLTDKALVCLSSCKNLNVLELKECRGITDSGVKFICDKIPTVTDLDVSSTSVTGKSIPNLVALKKLLVLYISDLELTDSDLEPLKNMTGLGYLDLSANRITDRTLRLLAELPNLATIRISECPDTTSDGAKNMQSRHMLKFNKQLKVKRMLSEDATKVEPFLGAGDLDEPVEHNGVEERRSGERNGPESGSKSIPK